MTTTDFQGGSFDLGRVVQRTFTSIGQNWLVFLLCSALLVGLPSLVTGYGQFVTNASRPFDGLPYTLGGSLLTIIGAYVLQGAVVFAAVSGFNGKQVDIGNALSVGLKFFFPLLGLAILMGFAIVLGFILLIIPGLILTVMWCVAGPTIVMEKRGVMESFQRSRDLTRGNRWMIFALMVIYGVLASILSWTVLGVGIAMSGGVAGMNSSWLVALVLTPIVNVVSGVVSSSGVASIYYELRTVKEGVAPDQLASALD
jgi:hypothetical protein